MAKAIVLTGSEELNRKLAALKGAQAKAAIRKASRTALRPIADAVKARAPRRTGALSRSVKVRALPRSRVRIGSRVTTSGTDRQFKGRTFYGGFQEYGWRAGRRVRNVDLGAAKGVRRTKSQAAEAERRNNARKQIHGTEFMKLAANDKKQTALSIYRSETVKWINELSKK